MGDGPQVRPPRTLAKKKKGVRLKLLLSRRRLPLPRRVRASASKSTAARGRIQKAAPLEEDNEEEF
jgi:hypothetical protein